MKCVECGSEKNVVRHHTSYSPEKVVLLCRSCEKKSHNDPEHKFHPVEKRPVGFISKIIGKMIGTRVVRIEVDEKTWNKVRAKASLKDMCVKDYANDLFRREVEGFDPEG